MMSLGFLLLLAVLVFGPKKTVEITQEAGRLVGRMKGVVSEFSVNRQ